MLNILFIGNVREINVIKGTGEDITIVELGLFARIGVSNTASVTIAGRLGRAASDVDQGRTVSLLPYFSPFAWLVKEPEHLKEDDGNLDIMGAVIVGIERGNCPEGAIIDSLNDIREALEQAFELNISQGRWAEFKDPITREKIVDNIKASLKQPLGSGLQASPTDPYYFHKLIAFTVSEAFKVIGCRFNVDKPYKEHIVIILGGIVGEDKDNSIFSLRPGVPNKIVNQIFLEVPDSGNKWHVKGELSFLGIK